MRTKHQFRPSGQWVLEDRIALSHASVAAEVASAAAPLPGLRANFNGKYLATPPAALGGAALARFNGSAGIGGLGNVRLTGTLSSNSSETPSNLNTQGTVVLLSRRAGGPVAAVVNGPAINLTSKTASTTQLHYTIVSAPTKLASLIGTDGTATLTLRPRLRNQSPTGSVNGQFQLRVVQS